jgi:hypothetical protein
MPDHPKRSTTTPRPPELKIGPFQGGIGVAVWLNEIQTERGPMMVRSVTINPRRYRDRETGEWKNSGSFRAGDLTALILSLEKAREFCLTKRLPGGQYEDEPPDVMEGPEAEF